MTAVDEIKNRLDIVDVVSENVKLRKTGKNYTGFCPFHPNIHTPSFVVFPDSGTWRCFGQCNEGGDIFKYVMKREGWDFPQTLKYLAEKAGVTLEPVHPIRTRESEYEARLSQLLEETVIFYRNQLQTPAGQSASTYLAKRGLSEETIDRFGLGYAPNSWDALTLYFSQRGIAEDLLQDTGLVSQRESGGVYDRFRNRIMIPIRSATGQMVGFGARILDPDDVPKFLNSPQTPLFDKGKQLFGLDQARKAIRAKDQVVVVEGYLDVICLHQAGFTNTVSPMGTALTEDQLRSLKKYTRRMILALDADAAGQKATMRGLEVARQAMDHETEIGFDVHGLLRQEARLQADIRVTAIPEGMDPDEVVLRDPQEWAHILETAKPLVIHVMETLAAEQDIQDPKVKQAIAVQVMPLIEEVPSLVEREAYRQRLARLLHVDEDALVGVRKPVRSAARRRSSRQVAEHETMHSMGKTGPVLPMLDPMQSVEDYILRRLALQPEMLHRLDRMLQQTGLRRIGLEDFSHTDRGLVFQLIESSLSQDDLDPEEYILANQNDTVREYLQSSQNQKISDTIKQEDLLDDLYRSVIRVRQSQINQALNEVRYLLEEDANDLPQSNDLREQVLLFTQQLQQLNLGLGTLSRIKS